MHTPDTFAILVFLGYTAFCFWVIFMDGAEQIEGWIAAVLIDWIAGALEAPQLKWYVGISWCA